MATLKIPVTANDQFQGARQAAVVLVEYGDYECPNCARAYPIIKRVQQHFGEQLGFVFRNFPLNEVHPHAESAAEAAEFAASNECFWEMHDSIFENQAKLGVPLLLELAESLGLSASDLRQALNARQYQAHVREEFLGGVRSGVNGTPTFFINAQRHDGPFDYDDLVSAIEGQVLAKSPRR